MMGGLQGKLKKLWLRIVLFIAGFAGVFIFLYPFVTKGIKNIGNLTGVVLGICLILYAAWFHRVNRRVKKMDDPDCRKSNMRDRFADCISCSWICGSRYDMHDTGIEERSEG